MGELEIIYPDGSGIEFTENEISMQHYTNCDGCNKLTAIYKLRSYLKGRDLDAIWLCKECRRVK